MVAPAGTPAPIVAALNRITTEALQDPTVKEKLAIQGATVVGDSPEHFHAFLENEITRWAKVIKDAGVTTEK
jgi:tripartite-type tricarboxylate transporter receptor subunit TctC